MQKYNLTTDEPQELHETRDQPVVARNRLGRLVAEKQWIRALLQICGRKIRPADRHRWQGNYEDYCRILRNYEAHRIS